MRIGEASRASGASARSLRYYEDEGLIVPGRFGNGYRDYCPRTIDRVRVIRSLLDSGLPVRLIREILPRLTATTERDATAGAQRSPAGRARAAGDDVDHTDDAVCAEFLREVEEYRDRIAARIAGLTEQRAALDDYLRVTRRPSR